MIYMIIGFMRNFKNPSYLTYLIAVYSKAYNINLIYLRPQDIDRKNGMVSGKVLVSNKWRRIQTDLPVFIDISPYCFKPQNNKIMDYLRANTELSDSGLQRFNK